jgi:hypothetical protein
MVGGDEYITVVLKIAVKYLIIKVAIEAQNVRMPEMRLNFNLTPQLMLYLGLLQLILEQHFQCHHILALPTAAKHMSEQIIGSS